jgi:S-adenosylmethionine/arginine decarboxylase-like enzyme
MKAKIWNKKGWIKEIIPTELKFIFEGLLKEAGFEIVGFTEKYFQPFGYSAIWLITESHFAVHTFPEKGKTYFEISSCNKEKYKYFTKKLDEYMKKAEKK